MSTTTTKQGFPVPSADGSDPPAGHTQIKALGDAIDGAWPIRSRGKSIITAQQLVNPANNVNTMLGTPDQIAGLVVPQSGVLFVSFSALIAYNGSPMTVSVLVNNGSDDEVGEIGGNVGIKLAGSKTSGAAGEYAIGTAGENFSFGGGTGNYSGAGTLKIATTDAQADWVDDSSKPLMLGAFIPMIAEDSDTGGEKTVTVKVAVKRNSGSGNIGMRQRRLYAYTMGF